MARSPPSPATHDDSEDKSDGDEEGTDDDDSQEERGKASTRAKLPSSSRSKKPVGRPGRAAYQPRNYGKGAVAAAKVGSFAAAAAGVTVTAGTPDSLAGKAPPSNDPRSANRCVLRENVFPPSNWKYVVNSGKSAARHCPVTRLDGSRLNSISPNLLFAVHWDCTV